MENFVIYTSKYNSLTIGFPGMVRRDENGNPMPYPSAKFKDGVLKLDRDQDKDIVERLDLHKANVALAGEAGSFRKQTQDVTDLLTMQAGEGIAHTPPDGIQEADKEALFLLDKISTGTFPPTQFNKVLDKATYIYERFQFKGIPKPREDLKVRNLRGRVMEMLLILENCGIWVGASDDENNREGKDSPSKGSKKD